MKLKHFSLFFLFFIFLYSCSKTTEPIEVGVTTTQSDLSNFQIILADYDSVVFKSNEDLLLDNKDVVEIILGTKDNFAFTPVDLDRDEEEPRMSKRRAKAQISNSKKLVYTNEERTIEPVYTKVGDKYRLEFEFNVRAELATYLGRYALRFRLTDETIYEIDAPVHFYQYPYSNTHIVFLYNTHYTDKTNVLRGSIQDFDIVGDWLYYHTFGGYGTFGYNLKTGENKDIAWNSGDWIAANKDFVFIDDNHVRLVRYNVPSDSVDMEFDFSQIEGVSCNEWHCGIDIYGLAVSENVVYALLYNGYKDVLHLSMFDFNGNYLGSDFNNWVDKNPFGLEYYDGILYSFNYSDGIAGIVRFDLNKNVFLETKPLPSWDSNGISIVNGRFHYSEYNHKVIYSIPMSDLLD